METIEERAKQYAKGRYPDPRDWGKMEHIDCRKDYLQGATDEREILIEKMSGWLHLNADDYVRVINYDGTYGVDTQMITDLRKYLKEER